MEQIYVIGYALVLGVILGIFYDMFRIIRLLFGAQNLGIFIQDIIYFLISGLVTFLFVFMFNFGESRFYILAGEALGWCTYHISMGDIIYASAKKLCKRHNRKKKIKGDCINHKRI